jgi:hypothetical protein
MSTIDDLRARATVLASPESRLIGDLINLVGGLAGLVLRDDLSAQERRDLAQALLGGYWAKDLTTDMAEGGGP